MFEMENKVSYITTQSRFQLKKNYLLLIQSLICVLLNVYARIFFKSVSLCLGSKANAFFLFKYYENYLGHRFIISKQIISIKINIRGQCTAIFYTLYDL